LEVIYMTTKFAHSTSLTLMTAMLMGISAGAYAVDGVILIDQARVNATGGFPYKISAPGSYRLASSLVAPLGKGGIDVSAGGSVSLDLNGFSVSSTARCGPTGLNCTPAVPGAGTPAGVWVHDSGTGDGAFSILNGAVSGFASFGIFVQVAGAVNIRDTKVFNNSASGILLTNATNGTNIVSGNFVWRNGGTGIFGGDLITNNTVTGNGATGLALQPTAGYKDNWLYGNGQGPATGGFSMGANVCGYQLPC
jgi:hypothetical protein